MTNNLYRILRNYDMELAFSNLQLPFSGLTVGEDLLFRDYGRKLTDKRLRHALRYGGVEEIVSDPGSVPVSELRLLLGRDVLYESWLDRARYLDTRIKSHPTRPRLVSSS